MFTPEVDPTLNEDALADRLRKEYGGTEGRGHFRKMCDRLHLYVTQGAGGRALTSPRRPPSAD
jgi:hypothetical protein